MPPNPAPVIALLGASQTLAWGSTYYLPAILANGIARDTGVGTSTVFAAFSCGLLVSAFLGPASGRLVDHYGGRGVLASSSLLFAFGLLMLSAAEGPAGLFASWLILGLGMGAGLYETAFSALARMFGARARSAITGITLIAGFASTICWPLSAWLDSWLGWRATCQVWAVAHLTLGLPLNLLLPRIAGGASLNPEPPPGAPLRRRMAAMAGLSFVYAATWFCSTSMAAHFPRLLQEAGASLPAAIAAAALVGPAQVAGRVLEFSLLSRVSSITSARVASLSHSVGAAGLLVAGAPGAMFFAVAHGAGNGVMTIANGTLPLQFFGASGYGLRQGLMMAPARLLQAGAPFAFDWLLSRYGTLALGATVALGCASFAVLLMLRPPERATPCSSP